MKRVTHPHATAETWLNGILDAIVQGEHEIVCLQPDKLGAIHALVAGPFHPDEEIADGDGGFRLDVETPGLFVLQSDPVPFDAPRLAEPLPAEHVNSLFTIIDGRAGPTKKAWFNEDTGQRGKSFLFDQEDYSRGIRVSAYLHTTAERRLLKLDVRHDSLDVKKWLDGIIETAHQQRPRSFEIRLDAEGIACRFHTCGSQCCSTRYGVGLSPYLLDTLIRALRSKTGTPDASPRISGGFPYAIGGTQIRVSFAQRLDAKPLRIDGWLTCPPETPADAASTRDDRDVGSCCCC